MYLFFALAIFTSVTVWLSHWAQFPRDKWVINPLGIGIAVLLIRPVLCLAPYLSGVVILLLLIASKWRDHRAKV